MVQNSDIIFIDCDGIYDLFTRQEKMRNVFAQKNLVFYCISQGI